MIDQQAAQTAYALYNARRLNWPYPHILPQNILAPDLFEALLDMRIEQSAFEEHVHGDGETQAERHRRYLGYSWSDVEEGSVAAPAIEQAYRVLNHNLVKHALIGIFSKELASYFGTTRLPLSTSLSYVEDESGYELKPHTDAARKAATLLIYIARDGDNPDLGTELYMPRDANYPVAEGPQTARHRRENFLRVNRVPFQANQGLAFAPSGNTFHGVCEVSGDNKLRRLLQFQLITNSPRAATKG